MKKTKKLLLLFTLMLGGLMFTTVVKANKMAWILENASLVCDPQALTPGSKATCYYFGTQKTGEYDTANTGFYLYMYTTQNLVLKDADLNTNVKNAGVVFVSNNGSSESAITQAATNMPKGLADNFKCTINSTKNKNSAGCAVYYTYEDNEDAFTKDSMKIYGYLEKHTDLVTSLNIEPSNAVVLGSIEVELPSNNNIEGCGELCIANYGVAEQVDWKHANCTNTSSAVTGWDGNSCGEDDVSPTSVTPNSVNKNLIDGDFNCYELTLKTVVPKNTKTGAFVSYAILAAGALIAISAVTISKKHNKLQRI